MASLGPTIGKMASDKKEFTNCFVFRAGECEGILMFSVQESIYPFCRTARVIFRSSTNGPVSSLYDAMY
jgi:hypothetical protein